MSKKILNHQIIKFNNKDSIMEVLANSFEIGKVQIHIHKYDESKKKGERITQELDVFVNIEDMLVLCQDILSGNIPKSIKKLKDAGKNYDAAWIDMGGVSAKKLEEREKYLLSQGRKLEDLKAHQKQRADKKSLSRVFKIVPSTRGDMVFTFQFESGMGEENETGLIVPKYGTKPEVRLMMAVNAKQAKAFALMIKTHIEAFINAKYTRMEDEKYFISLK